MHWTCRSSSGCSCARPRIGPRPGCPAQLASASAGGPGPPCNGANRAAAACAVLFRRISRRTRLRAVESGDAKVAHTSLWRGGVRMTERERQRKKEREREGATGRTKRGPCLNGQTQLTVMGSRQPLSVRVGVMPVKEMQVHITPDFKCWINS